MTACFDADDSDQALAVDFSVSSRSITSDIALSKASSSWCVRRRPSRTIIARTREGIGQALKQQDLLEPLLRNVPEQVRQWVPGEFIVLGTDGYGRSDARAELRHHFEVDRRFIVLAALKALADDQKLDRATLTKAIADLGIDPTKPNPLNS